MIDRILQDIRYTVRTCLRSPGFSLLAILTMAIGIGANTAIFSVVNTVLLRPLPFEQPDDLVLVSQSTNGFGDACRATLRDSIWSAPLDREGRPVSTLVTYTCRFEVR